MTLLNVEKSQYIRGTTKIEPSTVQNNIEERHATHKGAA